MKCLKCDVDKLSKEFPAEPETTDCDHPQICCLQCVVDSGPHCAYKNCNKIITADHLRECQETLDYLFPSCEMTSCVATEESDGSSDVRHIYVSTLTGDTNEFLFSDTKTVMRLKSEIRSKINVEPNRQRLLFNGVELQQYSRMGEMLTLKSFGVTPGSKIHLMIVLLDIPDDLDHVIFQLSWNYPKIAQRDFLDASCFMYMNDVFYSWVDWRLKSSCSMRHFGDNQVDDATRTGFHKIEAYLRKLPKCVSHLFFTLSSFRSPNIAAFPNPKLRFFDANDVDTDLTSYTVDKPVLSQAVIVCCVSRQPEGHWRIWEVGLETAGNARQFGPITESIVRLIKEDKFPGVSLETGKPLVGVMTDEEAKEYYKRCDAR